jgi:hypothetical protein
MLKRNIKMQRMIAQGELLETDFQANPCAKDGIDKDNLTLSRRRFVSSQTLPWL